MTKMDTITVHLRVDKKLIDKLDTVAEEFSYTRAEAIREAIRKFVREFGKVEGEF